MVNKTHWKVYDGTRIKVANALIEAEYSENFTEEAHKLARLIISEVQPNDTELGQFYVFSFDDLRNYLRYTSPIESDWDLEIFSDYLSEILECLISQPITIGTNDRKKFIRSFFISSWVIDSEKQIAEFEISKELAPYLVKLTSDFTSYLLGNIIRLDKAHSIRIYELLSQYSLIGKRTFEVEDLKRKLGYDRELCEPIEGTRANSNALLNNHGFLGWDLAQSQEALEHHTDISFEMEEHGLRNGIEEITFHIHSKSL